MLDSLASYQNELSGLMRRTLRELHRVQSLRRAKELGSNKKIEERTHFSTQVQAATEGMAKRKPPLLYSLLDNASSGVCMSEQHANIESAMQEHRLFPPTPAFAGQAHLTSRTAYDALYRESIEHPDRFWSDAAGELHWFRKWDKVLEW